jgi:hypothetical protein
MNAARIALTVLSLLVLSSSVRAERDGALDLRRRARKQLLTAAVMMPLASAFVAGGAALILDGFCDESCAQHPGGDVKTAVGAAMTGIGYGGILAGIPLLIAGSVEQRRANRMTLSAGASPMLGRGQAVGAQAGVTLRF